MPAYLTFTLLGEPLTSLPEPLSDSSIPLVEPEPLSDSSIPLVEPESCDTFSTASIPSPDSTAPVASEKPSHAHTMPTSRRFKKTKLTTIDEGGNVIKVEEKVELFEGTLLTLKLLVVNLVMTK